MKYISATIEWENDTWEEAEAIVQWVKDLGGNASIQHLTQLRPGHSPAFQVSIFETDRVWPARKGNTISFRDGRFTIL